MTEPACAGSSYMNDNKDNYTGFWMQLGCVLSALVMLAILVIIVMFAFNIITGR